MGAFRGIAAALLAGSALVSAGCALPPPAYRRSAEPTVRSAVPGKALFDYRGLIHVHSHHSKDSTGTLDDILTAAENAGTDFLIITDHSNMKAKPWEGMHGNMLVLVGAEHSKRDGHLLSIATQNYFSSKTPMDQLMDAIAKDGGFSIVAHPHRGFGSSWERWDIEDKITHMEVHNLSGDLVDSIPEALLKIHAYPANPYGTIRSLLDRPSTDLAKWDALNKRQKVVGIGSVDAHQKWYISYNAPMRMVSTHVLAPSLTKEAVYDALRKGRCYIAFEPWGETTGFDFAAENGTGRHEMGDSAPLDGRTVLRASVPAKARIDLYRDGTRIQSLTADRPITIPVQESGSYRIEAFRDGELWILSNPIYLK
jgi:hypothetical protein